MLLNDLKQRLFEAWEYTVLRRQGQPASRLLSIMCLLPHIRMLSMHSVQHIDSIKQTTRVPLEDLLAEMMDGSSKSSRVMPSPWTAGLHMYDETCSWDACVQLSLGLLFAFKLAAGRPWLVLLLLLLSFIYKFSILDCIKPYVLMLFAPHNPI